MESKFAHLRERDASVSMLRVKMSRRRSQSQKENRERAVNTRRNLDKLPELEVSSMDGIDNLSTIHERTVNSKKAAKDMATEERIKQLGRWKERKALEKEKEQRERERKGVFKTGMFHPKDYLNIVPQLVPSRAKETKLKTAPSQTTRVTRSMKEPVPRSTFLQPTVAKKDQPKLRPKTKVCSVEPSHRALSTRSANMPPVTAAPVLKVKPEDVRSTRSRTLIKPKVPAPNTRRNCKATANNTVQPAEPKEAEEKTCPPSPTPCLEKDMVVDQALAVEPVEASSSVSSFAPKGFVFQAPVLLSCFKFEPLTPRSADAFLKPSPSFILPAPPMFEFEPQAEQSGPSPTKSPRRSPARTVAPPTPDSLLESNHDVPYFRSEISNETDKLTTLCVHWEPKVENESIPEEMRDRMRTAVGQARLLMKERFKQFTGLVDDCELGRGEKITTCTDLQGFWDMVYYQVEDVEKKFEALKVAESRDWVEEYKPPPPRQRKVVKKPAAAKPPVNKAAVGSRLAAVKVAMKAKQQAAKAEKAAKDAGNEGENPSLTSQEPQPKAEAQPADMVVFDGGFFQVESPAKPSGSARRSSRRHAAVLPQDSPCSNNPTPRRVSRRPRAVAQTPVPAAVASPALPVLHTPAHIRLTLDHTPAQTPKSERGTPQSSRSRRGTTNVSLCFTPVREMLPADTQAEGSPETAASTQETPASVPELSTPTPVRSLPTITVVEEQDEPAEAVHDDMPLSPRLSLSPCKSPLAPEPSVSLSFTLSPCVSPIQPPISCPPAVQDQKSVCFTPDSSVVEELPGLDFERYLQPSLRCSMSPGETVAIETLSPMVMDVEMESPRGHSDDLPTQQEPAQPEVSSVLTLQSPQVPTAQSAMLLFTPDLKDRIRQSVCPSDLMVFTPPF